MIQMKVQMMKIHHYKKIPKKQLQKSFSSSYSHFTSIISLSLSVE